MAMMFYTNQNWRTSTLPWSLALANTINTGHSFNTPSNAVANTQWWASRGFQGYGPRKQYVGAGIDGLGSGCGCNGAGHCGKGMGQVDTTIPVDISTPVATSDITSPYSPQADLPVPVQNILSAWGTFGWPEKLILLGGAYMLLSTFLTTKRAYSGVTGAVRKRRATVRRRRERELEESGVLGGLV